MLQLHVESLIEKCFSRFEQLSSMDPTLPYFYRKQHMRFLEQSLRLLSRAYECLDASRPWIVYWILQSAHCLNMKFSSDVHRDIIHFLKQCQYASGGFGGGPAQYPHLAPTYAAILSLCLIESDESLEAIDVEGIKSFLWSIREPNGSFRMHIEGEVDVRGAYCAVTVARICGISARDKVFEGTAEWIASCQTYEGGFGGIPNAEAHGGYSFCAIAALALLGNTSTVNLKTLLRWGVNRQMRYEGGFQGRTNKLVDGCYSFWCGALIQVTQMLIEKTTGIDGYTIKIEELLFNCEALQEYILICCQKPHGGLIDKPGKPEDSYHTCYNLSGLSIAQNFTTSQPIIVGHADNEVLPTHPLYNISPKAAMKAYLFFQTRNANQNPKDCDSQNDEPKLDDN
jgi:protein farnesyltransferase subunit beta